MENKGRHSFLGGRGGGRISVNLAVSRFPGPSGLFEGNYGKAPYNHADISRKSADQNRLFLITRGKGEGGSNLLKSGSVPTVGWVQIRTRDNGKKGS